MNVPSIIPELERRIAELERERAAVRTDLDFWRARARLM